ncbi:cytochrome c biosynthesis protein [Agromyces sp. NBRC 114283]|nr:cytochrome c biosynthesis protein [Agromyces sp. NBRC 114283]
MSRSPSEPTMTDPARPGDHVDATPSTTPAAFGWRGWLRWGWRQLTSMRTALLLLVLLATAAVPGSIFPQRSADPNGVAAYFRNNPGIAPVLDGLQMFDLYSSAWFSAIYLLLFLSLIGCVIPRIRHHARALRSRPPRTPRNLGRLDQHLVDEHEFTEPAAARDAADRSIDAAERVLKDRGYRVERYSTAGSDSVSAERGYLRETGNLVFHVALVGVLVAVLVGSGNAYTGQRVIVEGTSFVNTLSDYSSFSPGRFVDDGELAPYSLTLDRFDVTYEAPGTPAAGQAGNFAAQLMVRDTPTAEPRTATVRVNAPIDVRGDRIYLLGNGYAPTITVRGADGTVIYREMQPFLPQDSMMTSLGTIKIPDGLPEQVGLVGFLYPTQDALASGAYTSVYPALVNPVVTFNVFAGDLGIDDGTPRSVYSLDTSGMTQLTGGDSGAASIELRPGETADLPNGWGTVTFEDMKVEGAPESVLRFASLQVQRDAGATWVLGFAVLATLGLITALLVPRRRIWVKCSLVEPTTVRTEFAALARGEDPSLGRALSDIQSRHHAALTSQTPTQGAS